MRAAFPHPIERKSGLLKMCMELHLGLTTSAHHDIPSCSFSIVYEKCIRWRAGCIELPSPRALGPKNWGHYLTTLFGNLEVTTETRMDDARPTRKLGWLPLLTVLFCISYGLMTMLVVEQGRTIDSQRALIRELFRDSMALNNSRMKALHDQRAAAQASKQNAPSNVSPSTTVPSTTAPSTQAQNQTPSSQAAPQHRAQNRKFTPNPFEPARPASDQAQDRRALVRI